MTCLSYTAVTTIAKIILGYAYSLDYMRQMPDAVPDTRYNASYRERYGDDALWLMRNSMNTIGPNTVTQLKSTGCSNQTDSDG